MPVPSLLTVSALALRAGCPESYVRTADRVGVVKAERDSAGRRLFREADVDRLKRHLESKRAGRAAA